MSEIMSTKETVPEELIRAEKLIDDAKVKEAHELLNNFEKKEGLTLRDKVSCLLLKCELLSQQGRNKEVLTLAEEIYDMSLRLGKNLLTVDCFISMALSLVYIGKYNKARDKVKQGEDLLKNINQKLSSDYIKREAYIAFIKGRIYLFTIAEDLGLGCFKRSLELGEKINFKKIMSRSLGSIAWNLSTFKIEFDRGLEYAKQSVVIAKESNSKYILAQAFLSLGVIYSYIGDFKKSIEILKESLAIFEELDNKERMAVMYTNLGEIYSDMGDFDSALEYLRKCLSLEEFTRPAIIAASLEFIVEISLHKGDLEQAKKYFQRLEQLFNKVKSKEIILIYRMCKALILKASSRFRDKVKAEEIFKQLIEETIFDFNYTFKAIINLCDLFLVELRVTNDPAVLDDIKPLIIRLVEIAEYSHSYRVLAEAYLLQAKLALINLNMKEAQRFLTQAQQIAERHGLNQLAMKISSEHKALIKKLDVWEKLKEIGAPMADRVELARLDKQIEGMTLKHTILTAQVTEEKVSISKEKKICLVCRGEVLKFSYICECGTIYCGNCAHALTDLENMCWACEEPIDYLKPVKKFKEEERIKVEKKKK